ncbi:low affinity iron permease family protein [Phytomonospora endophytica]|uniref:Low affinity Fe/Cu permease n=1 Tax=Phytomonospora endophytica TaxID=714109 RepID=A0A841G0Z0_9ACTN|nr:low affinity iron permease family protein [Phytomonospora endophytica]MBB6039598.1 low affinity Fe/Cu permease [Phytomonospora endophytica]GIG65685.1 hypothetical protein Pen01_19800 [Phytomonospora endophytica]
MSGHAGHPDIVDGFPVLKARAMNGDGEPEATAPRPAHHGSPGSGRACKAKGREAWIVAAVVNGAGSVAAAILAVAGVLAWVVVGLAAGFTRSWLDVLFAVSGAVTLVTVIVIQHTTGRRFRALTLQLDELLRVGDRHIGAERSPQETQEDLEHDVVEDRRADNGREGT